MTTTEVMVSCPYCLAAAGEPCEAGYTHAERVMKAETMGEKRIQAWQRDDNALSALDSIERRVVAREELDRELLQWVMTARSRGVSWSGIAEALHVSMQGAQQKYRAADEARRAAEATR